MSESFWLTDLEELANSNGWEISRGATARWIFRRGDVEVVVEWTGFGNGRTLVRIQRTARGELQQSFGAANGGTGFHDALLFTVSLWLQAQKPIGPMAAETDEFADVKRQLDLLTKSTVTVYRTLLAYLAEDSQKQGAFEKALKDFVEDWGDEV